MSDFNYVSISEIHDALVKRERKAKELRDYLLANHAAYDEREGNGLEDESTVDKIRGSETDFHNLSVEFSRQGCMQFAAEVALLGIKAYPLSMDLIADQIKYCQKVGNKVKCKEGFDTLKSIDRKYWNWRTYVFAIDFLKDGLSSSQSVADFEADVKLADSFIADFKKNIPHDERSYVAEAELCEKRGDFTQAMTVLEGAISEVKVAPQCCLKLADMKLERGAYDEVEKYARMGILMATEEQPSVSVGYLYYLLALAMDAKRIIATQSGNSVGYTQIRNIVNAFHIADRLLINEGRPNVAYRKTIKAKLIVLEMEENVSIEYSNDETKDKPKENQLSLSDLLQLKQILESNE